jgi:superoxide dismutase, Cu-Zn family
MQIANGFPSKRVSRLAPALICAAAAVRCAAALAGAGDIVVPVNSVDEKGVGRSIGTVTISESPHGLVFTPALEGLSPGQHGFHVHEKPECGPGVKDGKPGAALNAGGHLDPAHSGHHGTPWGDGHLGDLPALFVDSDGKAKDPVLAPRLKLGDVRGKSLMVHAGADNHSDQPAPLGGGGARVACGVIP